MKINAPKGQPFNSIDKGDVFQLLNAFAGSYFMKTELCMDSNYKVASNAIRLSDGGAFKCNDNEPVVLIDCELTIK